jgi:hypothetical protein
MDVTKVPWFGTKMERRFETPFVAIDVVIARSQNASTHISSKPAKTKKEIEKRSCTKFMPDRPLCHHWSTLEFAEMLKTTPRFKNCHHRMHSLEYEEHRDCHLVAR